MTYVSIDFGKLWIYPGFIKYFKEIIHCMKVTPENGKIKDTFLYEKSS